MIITSFTLTAFLGLESRRVTKDAATTKADVARLTRIVQAQDADISVAYTRLSEFTRKHPDFQSILLKYFKITTNAPAK